MKLNYKRTFFVGLAFMSISAFWQLYENIVPNILKYTFSFGDTGIGAIMALDNIVALFLLPLFGMLSDRTNTKLGKRTPFILCGTVVSTIMMILMPVANEQKSLALFVTALGIVLLSMGTYRSPAVSLMPDLTPRVLRSQANAVINLMGAAGGVLTLILIKVFVTKNEDGTTNYIPVFISVAVVMILAVLILLLKIRENKLTNEVKELEASFDNVSVDTMESKIKQDDGSAVIKHAMAPEVKKSFLLLLASIFLWFTAYNAVSSAFSRYVVEVWDLGETGFTNFLMVAMAAAIISYIPIGIVSSKIGRRKTILIGIITITSSYILGCLFIHYSPLIYLVFILTGFGWAAINVNSYPMVVEMGKGSDVGTYTGYYYSVSMTAQVMTPILSGFLLEHVSYYTLFPYAVFFSVCSFITMLMVKHGDAKPILKKSALENFDVED